MRGLQSRLEASLLPLKKAFRVICDRTHRLHARTSCPSSERASQRYIICLPRGDDQPCVSMRGSPKYAVYKQWQVRMDGCETHRGQRYFTGMYLGYEARRTNFWGKVLNSTTPWLFSVEVKYALYMAQWYTVCVPRITNLSVTTFLSKIAYWICGKIIHRNLKSKLRKIVCLKLCKVKTNVTQE